MYIRRFSRGMILLFSFIFLMSGIYSLVFAMRDQVTIGYPKTDDDPPLFADAIALPVMIPDTTLVAERLVSYDGYYVEDGSEEPVTGIAALYLHNAGATMITSCRVILRLESGIYRFEATCIPAGATVLVQEIDRRLYNDIAIYAVGGSASKGNKTNLDKTAVLSERYLGGLKVKNISDTDYGMLSISHKNYNEDENIYIGGVTYVTYISSLKSGEHSYIWPVHFSEESKIVCITGNKNVAQ